MRGPGVKKILLSCLFLVAVFVGMGIILCFVPLQMNNSIGIMMTLLSIIITIGVAYSFFSVYKANSEIIDLREQIRTLSAMISAISHDAENERKNLIAMFNKRICELNDLYNCSVIKYTFQDKNMEANGQYRDKKYLIAIKDELETILYLLQNDKALANEFRGSIGKKRSNISNDIIKFTQNLTEFKFRKIGRKEYTNSVQTIFHFIHEIKHPSIWGKIPQFEQIRYQFLFETLTRCFEELAKGKFPLPIVSDKDIMSKLYFYHKRFIADDKDDIDNGYNNFLNEYITIIEQEEQET